MAAADSPGADAEERAQFVPDPGSPAETMVSLLEVGETAVPSTEERRE